MGRIRGRLHSIRACPSARLLTTTHFTHASGRTSEDCSAVRRAVTLPLGIDIGSTRVRIALTQIKNGRACVESIAAEDRSEDQALSSTIAQAWKALGARERRCVVAIGAPNAELQCGESVHEGLSSDRTVVRSHPLDRKRQLFAVGSARRTVLSQLLATIRATPLYLEAVDHEAFALARAIPMFALIIDAGHARTSLHCFEGILPSTSVIAGGAFEITRQIQRDLAIDIASAEKRKRAYGTMGGGEAARDRFLAELTHAIRMRGNEAATDRIAMTGNGARLSGLIDGLRTLTRCDISVPRSPLLERFSETSVPGTEWNLAAGLSTWTTTV